MKVLTVRSKKRYFILRMMIYGLKIIGLAPFSIEPKISTQISHRHGHITAFKESKIGRGYNLLLLCFFLIFAATVTHPQRVLTVRSSEGSRSSAEVALYEMEFIMLVLAVCVVIVSWGLRQKKAASVMNHLLEVDVQVSEFEGQPSNKRVLVFLLVHVIVNLCLWITIWYTSITLRDLYSFFISFCNFLPYSILHWFSLEYIAIASLVARDLQTVNYYLLEMKKIGNDSFRPCAPNSRMIRGSPTRYSCLLASLKLLRSVRTKLSEICEDIAEFFSLPILFCIICSFLLLFRQLFNLVTFRKHNLTLSHVAFETYELLLMYVYPLTSLAINTSQAKNEAGLTARILHKLLAAELRRDIRAQLREFSVQLLHEDVKFRACEFFLIDSTMILAFLSATTSYMIVLIQYEELPVCETANNSASETSSSNSTFSTKA